MTAVMTTTPRQQVELEPDLDLDQISPWPLAEDSTTALVPPLRKYLIGRVAQEAGCSRWRARRFLNMFARRTIGKGSILSWWEMRIVHPVLDKLIPDDAIAAPGSLHELLNQRYCEEGRVILHDKTRVNRRNRCRATTTHKVDRVWV